MIKKGLKEGCWKAIRIALTIRMNIPAEADEGDSRRIVRILQKL